MNTFRQNLNTANNKSYDNFMSLGLTTKCIQTNEISNYEATETIQDNNFDHAQLRFVGRFNLREDEVDVLEITNLVLRIDPNNPDQEMLNKTFCLQGAPIGEWIPQRLLEPKDVRRYANFLYNQAKIYLNEQKFLKAAKRALSLSRILFLQEEGDEIINSIQPACNHATLLSREKLLEQVCCINRPIVDDLRTRIDALEATGVQEPDYDNIKDAVSNFLEKVDNLR